jgi:hypothetical protein
LAHGAWDLHGGGGGSEEWTVTKLGEALALAAPRYYKNHTFHPPLIFIKKSQKKYAANDRLGIKNPIPSNNIGSVLGHGAWNLHGGGGGSEERTVTKLGEALALALHKF